jgi:hypothetical protein
MKLNPKPARPSGSALLMSLLIVGVMAVALGSYLMLIQNEAHAMMRSISWNSGIPVAEAGLEEALTHISVCGTNSFQNNGWVLTQGKFLMKTRLVDGQPYVVGISMSLPPVIVAQGKTLAPLGTNYISRTLKVRTCFNALFAKAMVARLAVKLNGNDIDVDSFDSGDPTYSTNGCYDQSKRKDNATVATNSGDPNMLSAGNANIRGKIATGPGGLAGAGPNSCIGSNAWHDAGKKGIQPGAATDDMDVSFFPVTCPVKLSSFSPPSETVGATNYNYVMGDGDWTITGGQSFGGKVLVNGRARLLVTSDISFSGSDYIYIQPGASLELYVSAPHASLGGQGIQNDTGLASSFVYYGLPANTSLSFSGNAAFVGAIYAPDADFSMGGGGKNTYDFAGACVTRTITMNGKFNFHYDERLALAGPNRGYIATSWDELRQTWDEILSANLDLESLN